MHRSSLHQPNETSLEYEPHVASHSRPVEHLEFQPLEHDSPRDAVLVSGSGSRSNPFHCHTTSKTFENLMRPDKSLADNLGQSKRKRLFTRAIAVSSDRPNCLPSTNRRFREPQLTRTHQSQTSVTEQSNEMRGRNKKRRVSSGMPSTVPSRIATGLTVAPDGAHVALSKVSPQRSTRKIIALLCPTQTKAQVKKAQVNSPIRRYPNSPQSLLLSIQALRVNPFPLNLSLM